VAPTDRPFRERPEQQGAKLTSVDFQGAQTPRCLACRTGYTILVHDALGILAQPDEAQEALIQAGSLQRRLAAMLMYVEQPSLLPGSR